MKHLPHLNNVFVRQIQENLARKAVVSKLVAPSPFPITLEHIVQKCKMYYDLSSIGHFEC